MSDASYVRKFVLEGMSGTLYVIGAALLIVGSLALTPWIIMLLIGAMHHEFGFWQPIGFWGAVLLTLAFSLVSGLLRGTR